MLYFKAILAIFICHILTGSASVITRYLVTELSAIEIAFLRYLFGGLFIMPAIFFSRYKPHKKNHRILWHTILLGILFFAIFPYLFSSAFEYITSARGSLILASMPLWTLILSHFFYQKKISPQNILGIFITILGLTVAMQGRLADSIGVNKGNFVGETIMLLAAFVGGLYSVFAKPTLAEISTNWFTPIAMMSGMLFLLPWAYQENIYIDFWRLSTANKWLITYLGCISGGVAFYLMNWVINRVSPLMATTFIVVHPLSAMVFAKIFLSQQLTNYFFMGVFIVFIGLFVSQWPNKSTTP